MIYWTSQDDAAPRGAAAHDSTWRVAVYRGWMTVGLILALTVLSQIW